MLSRGCRIRPRSASRRAWLGRVPIGALLVLALVVLYSLAVLRFNPVVGDDELDQSGETYRDFDY